MMAFPAVHSAAYIQSDILWASFGYPNRLIEYGLSQVEGVITNAPMLKHRSFLASWDKTFVRLTQEVTSCFSQSVA